MILVVSSPLSTLRLSSRQPQKLRTLTQSTVFIGDVHGDCTAYLDALLMAEVIKKKGNHKYEWTSIIKRVVVLGDFIDRYVMMDVTGIVMHWENELLMLMS